MTYFLKQGNTYRVSKKEALDIQERLPAGNYIVKKDEMSGQLFLEGVDKFEFKGKIYGDTTKRAERILRSFADRPSGTGVMLTGEKGSGKTLLAKMLSIKGYEQDIPTIVINAPWCGDTFNAFIQSIEQPVIIVFDEFEKVYDENEQEAMLTLLDGVYPSKKLFVLTCNDKWRVNQHMRNRPGRIFYNIEYKGLEADFIREYCEDNLKAKEHIDKIIGIAGTFGQFNFDMLKALVEEMNRFDETPQEAMQFLNAKPEYSDESRYKIKLLVNGEEMAETNFEDKEWHGNPLNKRVHVNYKKFDKDEDGDEIWDWDGVTFEPAQLKKIDDNGNKYVFVSTDGATLVLTKVKEQSYRYWDAFLRVLYNKYPSFIDTDQRRHRTEPYPVSPIFMDTKYNVIFQDIDLKNKSVLDIGCCVGYSGAYVLDKGASYYHGIDISSDLCIQAERNLSQYFEKSKFLIENNPLEKFLESNSKFDVILAMGILYAVKDPVSAVEKLLEKCDTIVIESVHPHFPEELLEDYKFVSYDNQRINYNNTTKNANFIGSRVSLGLYKFLLDVKGFKYSLEQNMSLQQMLPPYYSNKQSRRFVIVGNKNNNVPKNIGYLDSITSNDLKFTNFV